MLKIHEPSLERFRKKFKIELPVKVDFVPPTDSRIGGGGSQCRRLNHYWILLDESKSAKELSKIILHELYHCIQDETEDPALDVERHLCYVTMKQGHVQKLEPVRPFPYEIQANQFMREQEGRWKIVRETNLGVIIDDFINRLKKGMS